MTRRLIASLCVAAVLTTGLAARTSAATTPPPPPNVSSLNPRTVLTDINGTVTTLSTSWKRLVFIGQDDDARPFVAANNAYAVIDIARHRLLSRQNTGGTIDNAAIDEQRGLAYLTVSTIPTRITGAGTEYHIDLWTIRLRDGKLLSSRLFYEGEQATVNAIGVDGPSGHVFVATTRPGSGTYELMMIDPTTMALHIQSLDGAPDHIFVDSLHHRVVVTTQEGIAATTSRFLGFDTHSEAKVWSHLFTYVLSSYANYTMVYNPRTQQIWSVAPGGLVTVVDAWSGHIAKQIQMAYTRPTVWGQVGFALDTRHNIGYAAWAGTAPSCYLDRAVRQTGTRGTFATYSPAGCGVAASTLISVDEAHSWVITADANAIHVFNGAGKEVRTISLVDANGQGSSWFTYTTIQNGSHTTLVFSSDVAHQNQATGATTTGAAVFVPMS